MFFVLLSLAALSARVWAQSPAGDQPASPAEPAYRLAWRYVTGGAVAQKAAVDHRGAVYVVSGDRNLYALTRLGRERWRFPVRRKLSTAPVLTYDGTVLVGSRSGTLTAVAPNGRLRWSFAPRTGACLTPAVARDGSIILATAGGVIYALNYTGEERWRYQVRSGLASSPSIGEDGTVYIGTTDQRLLALAPRGGRRWEVALGAEVGTPAIGADGSVYVAAAGIHRISPEGTELWNYSIPAATADPVIRADGTLIAGAGNGRLYALDPSGGKLWTAVLGAPVLFPAALGAGGTAYVPTDSNSLFAVSSAGARLWRFQAKQKVRWAGLGETGTVLVGAEDWILYALATASNGLSEGPWPEGFHDGQHTGRAGALADLDGGAAALLRELAYADSPELKRMALDEIQAHLDGRCYLAVHLSVMEEVLGYLAGEGVIFRGSRAGALGRSDPQLRLRACRLLGRLGSEGARAVLLQLLAADEDSVVKAASVDGLAAIGFDPDGELGRAILYGGAGNDERVLLAAAQALYRIILRSAGPAAPAEYRALGMLARAAPSARVRERASGYLGQLSRRLER